MNAHTQIIAKQGHNLQAAVANADDIAKHISAWLSEHPAVSTVDEAKGAAELDKMALRAAQAIKSERDERLKPLNESVAIIRDEYRSIDNLIDKLREAVRQRLSAWMAAEEEKRRETAAEAQRKADEAAKLAREAEQREREALENSEAGEIGVDLGAAISESAELKSNAERAERAAAIAAKDAPVRIATGIGSTTTFRTKEELTVVDPLAAVAVLGLTDKIREAILSGARDYRRLKSVLPAGVVSNKERAL